MVAPVHNFLQPFMTMGAKMNNRKGQAIFEFIVFLPIIIILYYLLITVSAAINGSINQQKITRGYFFQLNRYNSMSFYSQYLNNLAKGGVKYVGMDIVGWTEKDVGTSHEPFAACYEMKLFSGKTEEKCSDNYSATTNFIKPSTVFGVCGASYVVRANGPIQLDALVELGAISSGCRLSASP